MKKRLLLIEDNEDNRYLIKFALEVSTDWKIIAVSNGREGIDIAKLQQPDAILLDYIMPKMNGFTICQLLHDNLDTRNIPIIFVTAMVDSDFYTLLEDTHAAGVIEKPLNVNTLASQIQKICQWKKPS